MNPNKKYKIFNNTIGVLIFIAASIVYLLTVEPTASWWDCGEYIATSYKLQVGHPPGAPFFQLLGRFFTLFAFGDVTKVALMVNSMSAILSGLTILFTFWTITAIAKKFYSDKNEITSPQTYAIMGAGIVGALSLTFADSFWFSAVEGEVYATSATFTAAVVWAMTKWEETADSKYHLRWIVLIAFLMGLSIGVHLLNLLTIPALTYIYYFKKFKPSTKGFILTGIISLIILGFIQGGLIPWVVKFSGAFELFFVNSIGLPFNSGTLIYFILLLILIVLGLYYTRKKAKVTLNTIILAFSFILIGYSSFFMLVIRSNANTPINENAPKDAISLLGYLNRDQYGDWPVFYGQYFNAKVIKTEDNGNVYARGKENGKDKYVVINQKMKYVYDPEYCSVFPRMWSDQPKHIKAYKDWTGFKGNRKPSFSENLAFLFKNQIGNQYLRYFMWNFVGRQNDIQGFGLDDNGNDDIINGNWISGINFIDKWRLGEQNLIPEKLANNKARNTFYFLPLILGLIGAVFHFLKRKQDAFVVLLLFVLTGVAIIIYLNPTPYQPRERDYAYAGSFYAFALWIGIGVIAIYEMAKKKIPELISAIGATVVCLLLVPVIMGAKGWDDHDRSGKYACTDFAKNYLNSCAPNAILITNGDNDTFPLWYVQEVEGYRTDVRVVNFTLASGDWYIKQLFNKLYDSDPLPLSIPSDKYTQGTNDYIPFFDKGIQGYWNLQEIIKFINSDNDKTKVKLQNGKAVNYLPTKEVYITVDSLKVLQNGTVPIHLANGISKTISWKISKNHLFKNDLMLLDIIANNNWDRPIYFASPQSITDFMNIEEYCHLEGSVYRFIPVKTAYTNGILSDRSFDLMTNQFSYGNIADLSVYCDKESYGMSLFGRNNFARVAQTLITEGKKDKAIKCLYKGIEVFPDQQVPYDMYMIGYAELFYKVEEFDKGTEILQKVSDIYEQWLLYYFSLDNTRQKFFNEDISRSAQILNAISGIANKYKQTEFAQKIDEKLKAFGQ